LRTDPVLLKKMMEIDTSQGKERGVFDLQSLEPKRTERQLGGPQNKEIPVNNSVSSVRDWFELKSDLLIF
jgi:hypothetical protein